MRLVEQLKRWAGRLKTEVYALYLAYKDRMVPWYTRLFAALVVGYAFSPIDLIPDPIPILGYLDDLVLVPLGIALAIKMIPPGILTEHRERAQAVMAAGKPVNWIAAAVVVVVWISLAALAVYLVARL
ncbi:MAG TPA: YkvA family protein [Rubrobacteraceae bacterium]|nr:YkvA family protein [Rubrobacteraceae bacterium]